jgi:predicted transcriptional regulator
MDSAKSMVRKLLDQIPEDSTLEDIQYHIYVREKIEQGLSDIHKKRLLSQEEVEKRMSKWLGKSHLD